jgi:hypothetical protein
MYRLIYRNAEHGCISVLRERLRGAEGCSATSALVALP